MPLPQLRATNPNLEQGFYGGDLKSPWGGTWNQVLFMEERETKSVTVLKRERHELFYRTVILV
jgi:hypothetical protein